MQRTALMILALLLPAPALATVGPAPMACHDCVEEKDPPPPANNATFVAQTVPAAMVAGSTVTARVQMRNTGTTVWSHAAQYRLG